MRERATSISSPICRPRIACRPAWSLPKKHMSRDETLAIARLLLSEHEWQAFLKRGSADLARTVEGVRCRFNIFEMSARRRAGDPVAGLDRADDRDAQLAPEPQGPVRDREHMVLRRRGSTGSGKSTTVAASSSKRSIRRRPGTSSRWNIRLNSSTSRTSHSSAEREIERDMPSMQQGLLDSLREDPDVVVVGEMQSGNDAIDPQRGRDGPPRVRHDALRQLHQAGRLAQGPAPHPGRRPERAPRRVLARHQG